MCDNDKIIFEDNTCKTVSELRDMATKIDPPRPLGKKKGLYKINNQNCAPGGKVSSIMSIACPRPLVNKRRRGTSFYKNKYDNYKEACDAADLEIHKCDGVTDRLRENAREKINKCVSLRRGFRNKLYKPNNIVPNGNYAGHEEVIAIQNNIFRNKCGIPKLVPTYNTILDTNVSNKYTSYNKGLQGKSVFNPLYKTKIRKRLSLFRSEGEKYALSIGRKKKISKRKQKTKKISKKQTKK